MIKHTKKFTVGLIASLIGPAMIFAGCSGEKVKASDNSRFMKIEGSFFLNGASMPTEKLVLCMLYRMECITMVLSLYS